MSSKIKKRKQDGLVQLDKRSVKIISDHVKKYNPKSKKTTYVIENGKSIEKTAYILPRQLLKLNPFNHRFTTALDEIIEERVDDNQSPDFDMSKKSDIDQIKDMLRGIHPSNPDRKTNYDKLLEEIKNHSEIHGGNGLRDACIILADGTYVNGNRRDVVLDDLQQLETKKKKGGDPSKFDNIDVVICSENITYSDIRQMEIKEQVSSSLRDEYDFMNTAILIKEEFDNLIAQKGDDKKEQVIKTIASRAEGKGTSIINEYLGFLEFVDLVLEQLQLNKQYHKINAKVQGETKPVTTIVREWQKKWSNATNSERKLACLMLCAAYCQGVFKTAKNPGDEAVYKFTSRNHRDFKQYQKSKKAIAVIEDMDFWRKHDFSSDIDADNFGDKIQLADELLKNELWITKPSKVLNSVAGSLQTIDDALVGTRNKEVKSLLVKANATRYLNEFKKRIASIESKLKT